MDTEEDHLKDFNSLTPILLSTALKAAKMGVWSYDVKKHQFYFSEEFFAIFKTSSKEFGSNIMTPEDYAKHFIPEDFQPIIQNEIGTALSSDEEAYHHTLSHPVIFWDGTSGYIRVSFRTVRGKDGTIVYLVGVNQDITKEHLIQQELTDKNNRLKEASIKINKLIGHISHDLRSPVANIYTISELLAKNTTSDQKLISMIATESENALQLISSLLDTSAASLGKIKLEKRRIRVKPIILASVTRMNTVFNLDEKIWDILLNDHVIATIDPRKIEQLFDNLIANAIKYSPEEAQITLRLDEKGNFSITNKVSASNPERKTTNQAINYSTGFGMDIITALLEAHGISVNIKSNDTDFSVQFQFKEAD